MALIQATLASDLAAVFASMPASKEASALAQATAYWNYVQTALFGASIPVIPSALRDAMADTLALSLTVPGLPLTAANAWANALTVFWSAVVVAGGSGNGSTHGCPGASSVPAAIAAVYANLANTAATCGAGVAAALHTATLTVTATLTLPPNPPAEVPIS